MNLPLGRISANTLALRTCAAVLLTLCCLMSMPAHADIDTIYVNNTYSCPGNGSPDAPFCSIDTALIHVSGGPDTVFAVMGTGKPYREELILSVIDSGLVNHPFVLLARGAVTIDGGDTTSQSANPAETEPNYFVPRYAGPQSAALLWAARDSSANNKCRQVLMWSDALGRERRYPSIDTTIDLVDLPLGRSYYDPATDTVYVNFDPPTGAYYTVPGSLCTRWCVRIQASNVVVDGFTILRSWADGITVDGPSVRNVTVKNCIVKESREQGIDVSRAIGSVVSTNTCSRNTSHGIVVKTGSASSPVADCRIAGNTSYENDDDSQDRGGTNGIRIGSGGTPTTGHHVIERNRTYSNEDTGIEMNGSYFDTLRYNQSWRNLDHGFDHLKARGVLHVGELSYGNNRSGFSIEENAVRVELRNCVAADNGRETGRHDYELEVVRAARDSFVGDYNVLFRPSRAETPGCTHGEEADSILISWRNKDLQSLGPCLMRCADTDSCFGTVARFASAAVNANGNEAHSKDSDPKFVGAETGDFLVKTSSPLVDAADTTVVGWRTTDVLGLKRLDARTKANTGNPAGAFAEIGPYEHDDGAPTIQVELAGCTSLRVKWIARGESGDAAPVPDKYEVLIDGEVARVDTMPQNPGNWESEVFTGLEQYQIYTFTVRTTDEDGETAESNTAYGTPCCSPPCEIERQGQSRAVVAGEGEVDFPLGLAGAAPNPSNGMSSVSWSIPRAQAGAAYDLSLFDVAGRKVSTVANGTAKAGQFTQQLWFHARNGTVIHDGVYFLRLRIGRESLNRTVVLTR